MSAPEALRTLEMSYRWGEVEGSVQVEMGIDHEPREFGCEEIAGAFPICGLFSSRRRSATETRSAGSS